MRVALPAAVDALSKVIDTLAVICVPLHEPVRVKLATCPLMLTPWMVTEPLLLSVPVTSP